MGTACVGWLSRPGNKGELAGHAFLIGPSVALTCAHVVREHLGLGKETPAERPDGRITIRLEMMDKEVCGTVCAKGWFPTSSGAGTLSDIAVIELDEPLGGLPVPALVQTLPNQRHEAFVYGAEPGFQRIGQDVEVTISGGAGARGWRQLNQKRDGFAIAGGFSGAPVTDELGNVVWGMIVSVDRQGRQVSFAITAEELREALRAAGAIDGVRIPDDTDRRANAALTALVAELSNEQQRRDHEIAQLRDMVRTLEAGARKPETAEAAGAALDGLTQGSPDAAAGFFREQVRRGKELAERGRRDAALASRQLGQLLASSNVAEAAAAFRETVALDPADRDAWFSLGEQERALGSLARAASAYDQAQDLPADAGDPLTIWLLFRFGDIRREQGDLAGALDAFQKGHDIAASLAARDPDNAGWQRDLSVSHSRIGDVRRDQGDLDGALDAFQNDLAIAESLAAREPDNAGWQRDLSVSHERIGDVRRDQGDLAGALDAFQQSLNIREDLAARDPDNAGWQRDLSVSHSKIGDVRRDQGDLAGALDAFQKGYDIAASLAARDPDNAGWQRDLSSIYTKIGDFHRDQGNPSAALDAYRKALAISERLARLDPSNAIWQNDVSVDRARVAALEQTQAP